MSISACRHRFSVVAFLAIVIGAANPGQTPAQVITAVWTGASGNWSNPDIWNTAPITGLFPNNGQPAPTNTYDAQVTGTGTITVDIPITVDQLAFQSGTIVPPTTPNSFNVNNAFTFGGGTFVGGSINANGGVAFTGAGTVPILNGVTLSMGNGTPSTSTWSSGNITLQNNAILFGTSGNVLTTTTDGTMSGTGTFFNATFIKSGGTGTTTISPNITNNGLFEAASGTLQTTGQFTNNAGTLLAAGGILQINGTFINLSSGTLSHGTYQVQANSSLVINGTVSTIASDATVELDGANSTFSALTPLNAVNGTFRLTGGRQFTTVGDLSLGSSSSTTAGTLDMQSGSTMSITGKLTVPGPAAILSGAISVAGATTVNGTLTVGAGASLLGSQQLTVNTGGTLAVQGTVTQPVTSAGVVMGNGHITGPTIIQQGGFLRPGNSPGTIGLDGGLTLDGNYDWDLNGNDNTMAGGTFDKVNGGGVVTLAASSQINIMIGGGVDFTNPFWSTPESWLILSAPGGFADGTIPGLTINTNSYLTQYPSASFSLSEDPNTQLFVNWAPSPVPEPGSAAMTLIGLGVAGWLGCRRKKANAAG